MTTALVIPLLLTTAGGVLDLGKAYLEKENLQELLDAATLAAAAKPDASSQASEIKAMLSNASNDPIDFSKVLNVASNSDGSLTAVFNGSVDTPFLSLFGLSSMGVTVKSTAIALKAGSADAACIYVLGNQNQAVLINSGANIKSEHCGVHVQSTSNPAFIMNSGATVDTAKFCVKGTQYIKNGGTLTHAEYGCAALPDPYAGKLPEPTVSSICTTSGWKDGTAVTMKAGVHCETGFNGSPTITFEPGLHIIKGRMIINSNATVIATGVTFYFPDVNSEIRINGGVKFTGSAPTTGPYKGIFMFEKTSDAGNNANKQQYIFNGSKGETLEGLIYLPNRDVTYNSTTNQVSKIALVVNTMIMNSSNWLLEPYTDNSTSSTAAANVRLVN